MPPDDSVAPGAPSFHPSAIPRGQPRVISIGGGRGGVGKSLLTVNLGVYLAQLGRSVIVADADPAGACLHTMFGLDGLSREPARPDDDDDAQPISTAVPGLRLMPPAYDTTSASPLRTSKKARWLTRLRDLGADYVLIDLGAGIGHATLDLFLASEVGVCVAVPEPPAIEATYRFLRALFIRRLRRSLVKERFKLRLIERAMKDLPALPSPAETIAAIARYDTSVAEIAASELAKLHPRLAVCQTRIRSDLDVGPAMRTMASKFLSMDLDYLGHVEHDDAVWLTVRRRRPLLIDSPTSKSARNVERIARRVLALAAIRDPRATEPPRSQAPRHATLYETLGVNRTASDEEVRRAYKRQRELYAQGSLPLTSLLWGDELAREQASIEEAHETLLDPARRRAYDLSTFPETEALPEVARDPSLSATGAEITMLRAELLREINAETLFTGALLRKVRESQGVELGEIAGKTKIATGHLRAIEDEAFTELPAIVYARGFVQELAKFLGLDPSQVSRTYLKRMREALLASGRDLV